MASNKSRLSRRLGYVECKDDADWVKCCVMMEVDGTGHVRGGLDGMVSRKT